MHPQSIETTRSDDIFHLIMWNSRSLETISFVCLFGFNFNICVFLTFRFQNTVGASLLKESLLY